MQQLLEVMRHMHSLDIIHRCALCLGMGCWKRTLSSQ